MATITGFMHGIPIRMLAIVCAITTCFLLLLASCQSKLLYYPRQYPVGHAQSWLDDSGNDSSHEIISYETSQGQQHAFLQGNLDNPRCLWIVCGGNATVALDWSDWITSQTSSDDAWLLFDMPGYGDCDGYPSPGRIKESLQHVMPKAFAAVGWQKNVDSSKLRFFGHSLGCAVVLMAASEYEIQQGVLLAPFTSTMEMANIVVGLPVGFLVTQRFDNLARLSELEERGKGEIAMFHGTMDPVIPTDMSRQIQSQHPEIIDLHVIQNADHNTIHHAAAREISDVFKHLSH